ncbi:MAG: hypothetical protein H8M99_00655 [Gloeobacteraceae cyanobacterium ES-bin-144]|nr:hypothetical protein [Verrucomicrobiales bacterium]
MKISSRILIRVSCVMGAFALIACAGGSVRNQTAARREIEQRLRDQPTPAVLFIGNSYSFGAPRAFKKIAAERGRSITVDQATRKGWSLARHANNRETLEKIHERHWDIVVLQEYSELPSQPLKRNVTMFPSIVRLSDELRRQGSIPVLYQTWAYRAGDPKKTGDDFKAMNKRVREGYNIAAQNAGGLFIVPVGDGWEREVSAGHASLLFMPDGKHPTPRGNELTARVFADCLLPK